MADNFDQVSQVQFSNRSELSMSRVVFGGIECFVENGVLAPDPVSFALPDDCDTSPQSQEQQQPLPLAIGEQQQPLQLAVPEQPQPLQLAVPEQPQPLQLAIPEHQQPIRELQRRPRRLKTAEIDEVSYMAFRVFKVCEDPLTYALVKYKVEAPQENHIKPPHILDFWQIEIRVRSNGVKDKFYNHASSTRTFRSTVEVSKFIKMNFDHQSAPQLVEKVPEGVEVFDTLEFSEPSSFGNETENMGSKKRRISKIGKRKKDGEQSVEEWLAEARHNLMNLQCQPFENEEPSQIIQENLGTSSSTSGETILELVGNETDNNPQNVQDQYQSNLTERLTEAEIEVASIVAELNDDKGTNSDNQAMMTAEDIEFAEIFSSVLMRPIIPDL